MCVYIHTCACTSERSTLGVLFYCLPPSLRQNLSLTLELTKVMSRLARKVQRSVCLASSLHSQPWVCRYMCLAVNMGVEDPLTHWPISSAPRGTVFNQGRGRGGGSLTLRNYLVDRGLKLKEYKLKQSVGLFVCFKHSKDWKRALSKFSVVKRYVVNYNWNCCNLDIISLSKAIKLYRFRT